MVFDGVYAYDNLRIFVANSDIKVSCMRLFSAALHLACVIQQKDVKQWFAELAVDIEKVRQTE